MLTTGRTLLAIVALGLSLPGTARCQEHGITTADTVMVRDVAQLRAALLRSPRPHHVRLLPGEYPVDAPLVVPDGMRLEGSGVMLRDDGRAAGFAPGTASVIRAASAYSGDLVTLGDESVLARLTLIDRAPSPEGSQRSGNVIMAGSRRPGDRLSAEIRECEIVGTLPGEFQSRGPVSHAIVVLTQNPGLGEPPDPHVGAQIALRIADSVVRSADGVALFINNFASDGRIAVTLENCYVEGMLIAVGGTSRPDTVAGARTVIHSRGNKYVRLTDQGPDLGWMLFGGASQHRPSPDTPGAHDNLLEMVSTDDRIVGFDMGVQAAGARRLLEGSGPLARNRLDLTLQGTRIERPDGDAIGLALQGALSTPIPIGSTQFPVGTDNVLTVRMRGVRVGGGPQPNRYADADGVGATEPANSGNRLIFAGNPDDFAVDNPGLAAPPARYFEDAAR